MINYVVLILPTINFKLLLLFIFDKINQLCFGEDNYKKKILLMILLQHYYLYFIKKEKHEMHIWLEKEA